MTLKTVENLQPAPVRNVLVIDSKRAEEQVNPLASVGVKSHVITASKWAVIPRTLAQEHALKAANIDVIIAVCPGTHITAAMMLRDLLNAPVVFRMRGNMWAEYQDRLVDGDRAFIRAWVEGLRKYTNYNLVRVDAVLPVASHLEQNIREEIPTFAPPVLPVPIPVRSVPPPTQDPERARRRWSPDGRGLVASITNFNYWKKVSPMLEAAPALVDLLERYDLLWVIAGGGPYADRFYQRLAEVCPKHLWSRAGFIDDPWSLLRASLALLHISEMDGLPNVLLEAHTCGCPPVCNSFPAMTEFIVHGRTGLLADTPQGAAAQLEKLIADDSLRRRLVAEGRDYVARHYTNEAIGRKYIHALNQVKAAWSPSCHLPGDPR